MKSQLRDLTNLQNAQKSTGPLTLEGKERSRMNAFKHGLTGNHILLQEHEREAYNSLTTELTKDLAPQTELERQLVQKIIDAHTRLNRIAALDANLLNVGTALLQSEQPDESNALDTIAAQVRAWSTHADNFDKLGRYESRIARQLLQYTKELERLQLNRKEEAREEIRQADDAREAEFDAQPEAQRKHHQTSESQPLDPKSASFRTTPEPIVNSHVKDPLN